MPELQKPDPLIIGGKAFYTLTSYEPVEVEVKVPAVSDEELEIMVSSLVADAGGSLEDLANAEWVEKHFPGVKDANGVREQMRAQLMDINARYAEEQKRTKCLQKLAERLGQAVPPAQVSAMRASISQAAQIEAERADMSFEEYLATLGIPADIFELSLDQQAKAAAEQDAALDAYVSEKKIKVDEVEYARYLGMSAADTAKIIEQVKSSGQSEMLKATVLRQKAVEQIVAECSCTYQHESPDETKKRVASLRSATEERAKVRETKDSKES